MVYSQICSWLDDFVDGNSPEELLDTWDLTEWIEESEIITLFEECVIPTYKNKKSRDDATTILKSLIWEYYLYRQAISLQNIECDISGLSRVKQLKSCSQHSLEWHLEKYDLLTASEFSDIYGNLSARVNLIKNKMTKSVTDGIVPQTVFLSKNDKLSPTIWGNKYETVVRDIYVKLTGCNVFAGLGRIRHPQLINLAASPDGIVESGDRLGRLLEIKSPISRQLEDQIIPRPYYCQIQIQLEVCDLEVADYCECKLETVKNGIWKSGNIGPAFIGAVAVIGNKNDYKTWKYVYSPLFENTEDGRNNVTKWKPDVSDNTILELSCWQITGWQLITVRRNRRWWNTEGLPEYNRFWKDTLMARQDPSFLTQLFDDSIDPRVPLFVD
jgi:hypothetical protein